MRGFFLKYQIFERIIGVVKLKKVSNTVIEGFKDCMRTFQMISKAFKAG